MEEVQGQKFHAGHVQPITTGSSEFGSVQGQTFNAADVREVNAGEVSQSFGSVEGQTISSADMNGGEYGSSKGSSFPEVKLYSMYCEPCGFRKLTDGSDLAGFVPYKQSAIPGGSPYLDPLTGKTVTPKVRQNTKKFKCPKCGRVITVKKIADPTTYTGRSFDE